MRYVIHMGVHKTGTTTVQNFLAQNAAALLEHGVYYPVGYFTRYPRQHSGLAAALRRGDTRGVRLFFRHCRVKATAAGAHTVLLSGEEISTLGIRELRVIRREIRRVDEASETLILIYYRNLYDLAISQMQQTAKKNRRVFDGPQDKRMIARMDPTQQIVDLEFVFGTGAVRVGMFETAIREGGLERDLLRLADIDWSDSYELTDSRNVSMDVISTMFLNMLGYEYGLDAATWRSYAKIMPQSYTFPSLRNDMVEDMREIVSAIDVSHPKLAHVHDILTEVKKAPIEARPDVAEFLTSFEALVHEVRKSVKGRNRKSGGDLAA